MEGGKIVWKSGSYVGGVAGITGGRRKGDYVSFDVGSGAYRFKLTAAPEPPVAGKQ